MNVTTTTTTTTNTLSLKHAHPRDKNISFQEDGHKYTILNDTVSSYTSVTTWVHHHFPKFDADSVIDKMMNGKNWNETNKYYCMTKEEIKKQWNDNGKMVSSSGTELHYKIECFMNTVLPEEKDVGVTHLDLMEANVVTTDITNAPIEWEYFLSFIKDHPNFKPYRTEWLIYEEDLKLSGSIDMVYQNEDDTYSIYDWKRCKAIQKTSSYGACAITEEINHLPDCNYWHYCLQLNTYKAILERKYGKKIRDMFLIQLHPDMDTYKKIQVVDLQEDIDRLFLSLERDGKMCKKSK